MPRWLPTGFAVARNPKTERIVYYFSFCPEMNLLGYFTKFNYLILINVQIFKEKPFWGKYFEEKGLSRTVNRR